MIISKLDWQYNYWIDLSDRWAEVFSITMEEFQKIQSWLATMVEDKVVENEVITPAEPTQEELATIEKTALISKINELQELAKEKRLEYTTVRDMLPEWNPIREMKLDKLSYEGDQLLIEFERIITELVEKFGENILSEII